MADGNIIMDSPRKKVAYDPDQDPEEKRVLRQKYRVLLKDEEGAKAISDRSHRGRRINDNKLARARLPFFFFCQAINTTSMNIRHRSCSKRCSWPIRSSTKVHISLSL